MKLDSGLLLTLVLAIVLSSLINAYVIPRLSLPSVKTLPVNTESTQIALTGDPVKDFVATHYANAS